MLLDLNKRKVKNKPGTSTYQDVSCFIRKRMKAAREVWRTGAMLNHRGWNGTRWRQKDLPTAMDPHQNRSTQDFSHQSCFIKDSNANILTERTAVHNGLNIAKTWATSSWRQMLASSKTTKLEAVKTYQYNGKRTKEWCTVGREESPLMLTPFQLGCISKVGMNQQMLSRTKNWHDIFNHTPFRKKPRQILVNSARTTEPLT